MNGDTYILTHTGAHFRFADPDPDAIRIEDIAHALAHLCRFTGHVRRFHSVAQHSVCVAQLVPAEHRLAALMHDASEAFLGDVSKPLKSLLPDYQAIERRVQAAIMRKFGLPEETPPEVHVADMRCLALEKEQLMSYDPKPWPCLEGVTPPPLTLEEWWPAKAEYEFLREFERLT